MDERADDRLSSKQQQQQPQMVVVRCWGCSTSLRPPLDAKSSSSKTSSSSSVFLPRFLCGHCGAINATAQEEEFRNRRRRGMMSSRVFFFSNNDATTNVKQFCVDVPARCLARTMGRILIPTVLSLVYFLVSRTYRTSIPKLTIEKETILSGEMATSGVDVLTCFVLRVALLLACVNIYWNYAISILSRPKSIRSLREDGEESPLGSESESDDGEDVESGRKNRNRNGLMPVPWCQQQRVVTRNHHNEMEMQTDVENNARHPTTVVPRDSFRNCAYCMKCDDVKPFGTSHCSTCNKCIVDLDHHCPFLQNCVGKHNVRAFTCFCLWCSLGCLLAFIVAILLPFTSQRAAFMKPYERVMSEVDKYSNFGKSNKYEYIGHFPTSTAALVQYIGFALRYVGACEDTWIGTWSIVVLATATITPLTFGLFYQTYMAVKRGEFYVASLKAKREKEERGSSGIISGSNSPETMARDASGLSRHVEDARVRAVFERTKGEHWVFWFLFPRLSRTGGFGRRGGMQKVQ